MHRTPEKGTRMVKEPVLYEEMVHTAAIFAPTLAFFCLFHRDTVPGGRAIAMGTAVFTFDVTTGSP